MLDEPIFLRKVRVLPLIPEHSEVIIFSFIVKNSVFRKISAPQVARLLRCYLPVTFIFLFSGFSIAQTNPGAIPIPVAEDFTNNWFTSSGIPAGFAVWTAAGAPRTSNSSASVSNANGDENSFDSATVVKSTGKAYGYSGVGAGGVNVNNGQLYIQTTSSSSGTDQLMLAINTTGYTGVTVSFDVEMINPQPKKTGYAFQYRVGTSGAFTVVDTSYWHNNASRIQNQIDSYVNLTLPSGADNKSVVQLRWAASRDVVPVGGASCGIAFDNIVVSGTPITSPLYFRTVASGNWTTVAVWESSPDNISWSPATRYPSSAENSITIRNPHVIKTTGMANLVLDETIVDEGATLWNAVNTNLGINDGPGVDLIVYGTFSDSSNYSVVWTNSARWQMGPNGTLVKTTNTNSTNWQLKYENGISTIPATSNWICRKPAGATTEPSISTTNGGPPNAQVYYGNLYIENNSVSWNTNNLCKFSGSNNYPIIKGNFYLGGNGNNALNFTNSNTHASPLLVMGNVNINSLATLTISGTGLEVQGNMTCAGTYTYSASTSKLLFSGVNIQQVIGSGSITTYRLEINKSAEDVTLSDDIYVYGNLNLLAGIFNTNSVNKIIVADNATSTNASNVSFVDGPLKKVGDDAFIYPVGKNGYLRTIAITAGGSTTDAFTGEYFHVNPQAVYGNNLAAGINHISQCEYWMLVQNAGTSIRKVTLSWDGNSCGVTFMSQLLVARYNAGTIQWVNEGNTLTTGNNLAGTVRSADVSGYGPFTLASTTTNNPLPISLLYFNAKSNGKEVLITWETGVEVNNQVFTIQRSKNGIQFEDILFTNGAGNSTEVLRYSQNDKEPYPGVSYYRLKQTDFDGKYSFSDIAAVKMEQEQMHLASFIASKENSAIDFDLFLPGSATVNVTINTALGRSIYSVSEEQKDNFRHYHIDGSFLAAGIYYINIMSGEAVIARKFYY